MAAQGDIVFMIGADVTGLTRAGQTGEQSLADMEKAAKTLERQIDRIGAAGVAFQREMNKLTGVSRDLGKSARDSAAAFEAFEKSRAQVESLRASIDPLYAASRRYEQALGQLDTALEQGAITARDHAAMMDQLATAYLRADGAAEVAGRGVRSIGGNFQNVGFQLQDFAVQVGNGTSASIALAQQLPQLTSGFGPVGVAVGLAAAALPLLGMAFNRASDDVMGFEEALKGLTESTATARDELLQLQWNLDTQEQVQLTKELGGLIAEQADLRARAVYEEGVVAQYLIDQADAMQAQIDAARARLNEDKRIRQEIEAIRTAQVQREQAEERLQQLSAQASASARYMLNTVEQLARADINSPWDRVVGGIQRAINKAAEYARTANFGMSTGNMAWAQNSLGFTLPGSELLPPAAGGTGGGSGGGGGGGADPMQARIDQLLESLKTQDQIVAEWYASSLEALNAASDAQLEAIGGRHTAIERLEEEHQKRLAGIREMGNEWGLQAALQGGAQILGAMGSMNKQALKAQAVFASAAALIDTYQGAAAELRSGTIGFAKAAAVVSRGLGFVAAIKNASSSGGASGGGGGSAATAQAASAPTIANITVSGQMTNEVFGSLVQRLNAELKQGYRINLTTG